MKKDIVITIASLIIAFIGGYAHGRAKSCLPAAVIDKELETMELYDKRGAVMGTLRWNGGSMSFEGNIDKSARIFFETGVKPIVDAYIERRCGARA